MSRAFAVGLLFLVSMAALAYMFSRLSQEQLSLDDAKIYATEVKDATGLPDGAAVKVAGINVGRLREKSLHEGKARLTLEIAPELRIHRDARITLRSIGYLGDRYLDLDPGSEELPLLGQGSTIPADEGVTIEALMEKGGALLEQWTGVATSLRGLLGVR